MLNFEPFVADGNDFTRSMQFRHSQALADLIARASLSLGVDKSVYLRSLIAREAQRILDQGSRHVMTAEDAAVFATALAAPARPSPRARTTAAAYRRRILHAD